MRKLLLILTALPLIGLAQLSSRAPQQHPHERKVNFNDSVQFYRYVRNKMVRDARSAVTSSSEYEALNDTLRAVRKRSNNYLAFTIFFDKLLWNVDGLNNQLAAIEYPPIRDYGSRIGFGISSKKKRRMFDLQFLAVGVKEKAKKGEDRIEHSFHGYLNFTWGYDILNPGRWSLYPYAGVGRRKTKLKYTSPTQVKSDAANITELIENETGVSLQVDRLGYLAGIEADLGIYRHRALETIHVFLRAGINAPFKKEYYAKYGKRFDTGMNETVCILSCGLKFGGRK